MLLRLGSTVCHPRMVLCTASAAWRILFPRRYVFAQDDVTCPWRGRTADNDCGSRTFAAFLHSPSALSVGRADRKSPPRIPKKETATPPWNSWSEEGRRKEGMLRSRVGGNVKICERINRFLGILKNYLLRFSMTRMITKPRRYEFLWKDGCSKNSRTATKQNKNLLQSIRVTSFLKSVPQ